MKQLFILTSVIALFLFSACNNTEKETEEQNEETISEMQTKVNEFASFTLTADMSKISEKEKQMLPFLFEAANIMNEIFWIQAYGDKDLLIANLKDEATKEFAEINYGPWERLKGNEPFIDGIDAKPLGSNFYPYDMSKEEFENTKYYEVVTTWSEVLYVSFTKLS